MATKTASPKAKKVANPQKKLLITAAKKTINANTVLPILEDILFLPGKAIVTDLETFVVVPFDMEGVPECGIAIPGRMFLEIMEMVEKPSIVVDKNFGVELVEGKRRIKLMGENPDNFPKTPDSGFKPNGIVEKVQTDLTTALCFVSNDDLRPAMTGVYFEAIGMDKQSRIVATDAHRLFHRKIAPMATEFILPSKSAKIIISMGGEEWKVEIGSSRTRWTNEAGVQVISRSIDARFPDYKVVLPDEKDIAATIHVAPETLLQELKNAGKFANKSTNEVRFTLNGNLSIASQDVDFSFEYKNEVSPADFNFNKKNFCPYILKANPRNNRDEDMMVLTRKKKDGVMQYRDVCNLDWRDLMQDDELSQPVEPKMSVAFNGKFLSEIIHKIPNDECATIQLWGPSKAAIINKEYLLMPLLFNQ